MQFQTLPVEGAVDQRGSASVSESVCVCACAQTRDQLKAIFHIFSYFLLMYDINCSHIIIIIIINVIVSFSCF